MAIETIKVPDIGGAEGVDVIEINVAIGDVINVDDTLIVLESDKASMDIPSSKAGRVVKILVKEGDKVSEGADILELDVASDAETNSESQKSAASVAEVGVVVAQADSQTATSEDVTVQVPDLGGAENVDVIEVCVKPGQAINEGDSLVVLESDKASLEVPSPASGTVISISVKEGDKVSEGSDVLILSVSSGGKVSTSVSSPASNEATMAVQPSQSQIIDLEVPDIGGAEGVEVIEVSLSVGRAINEGDSIIVLESDKASMEIPAPKAGKVVEVLIKEGDKVSKGALIGRLEIAGVASAPLEVEKPAAPAAKSTSTSAVASGPVSSASSLVSNDVGKSSGDNVYAGPAVRKLARQLGVKLDEVKSSGPRGRLTKDDVRGFVKNVMENRGKESSGASVSGGSGIPAIPSVDFAQFGEIELVKMSKIKKVTSFNMTRNWLNVPHVTQFDDADITDLESFRKSMKDEAEKAGVKLTPLPFLLKACAAALKAESSFNVSLHADGEHIVQKKYIHIGMAVDTPNGLVVPVIRNVDQKGLFELAAEATALAKKARDGKLLPKEMQGGCFTISSLGAIGGKGFTPIVNAPEVAILGVSRADTKPVWDGKAFVPRLMLPLCLSYDHRAINGGDAGRFLTHLTGLLSEVRRLLL